VCNWPVAWIRHRRRRTHADRELWSQQRSRANVPRTCRGKTSQTVPLAIRHVRPHAADGRDPEAGDSGAVAAQPFHRRHVGKTGRLWGEWRPDQSAVAESACAAGQTSRPREAGGDIGDVDRGVDRGMKVGDCCHHTAGARTVSVIVRDVRTDGLILVQSSAHGASAYSFLVRGDTLVPEP
jgi:hypothetical protein